jgi:hypothetical protein
MQVFPSRGSIPKIDEVISFCLLIHPKTKVLGFLSKKVYNVKKRVSSIFKRFFFRSLAECC